MRVLLPPSETKVTGGGSFFRPDALSFHEALGDARTEVRSALEALSRDEAAAVRALKLGAKSRAELAHNLVLAESGAMPAIERYTGVLFDAIDLPTVAVDARSWINEHVLLQSALFGLISAADEIPAYRLSASSRLITLTRPLVAMWKEAHRAISWERFGWVLDLRSQDYASLAPRPAGHGAYLRVSQRSADGNIRALNHFNKAAKGALVRRLADSSAGVSSTAEFQEWAASSGLEVSVSADTTEVTLIIDQLT